MVYRNMLIKNTHFIALESSLHLNTHEDLPTSVRNISTLENTTRIASSTCKKKRLKMMKTLIIKKKKPVLNNIKYEHDRNVLNVFRNE